MVRSNCDSHECFVLNPNWLDAIFGEFPSASLSD